MRAAIPGAVGADLSCGRCEKLVTVASDPVISLHFGKGVYAAAELKIWLGGHLAAPISANADAGTSM